MKRIVLAAFTILLGCSMTYDKRCPNLQADLLAEAKRLVALDRAGLKIDCPHGEYAHQLTLPGYNHNGSFTGAAGVMIEDVLYYEALGIGSAYSAKMRELAHESKGTMAEEQFQRNAEKADKIRSGK